MTKEELLNNFRCAIRSRKNTNNLYCSSAKLVAKYEQDIINTASFLKESKELLVNNTLFRTEVFRIDEAFKAVYEYSEENDCYVYYGSFLSIGKSEMARIRRKIKIGCYVD